MTLSCDPRQLVVPGVSLPQHYSASNEHYTPPDIIGRAIEVMGDIDLDPASSDVANSIVKAHLFYPKKEDGLAQEWNGRVWLNPPGGRVKGKSFASIWWSKLVLEYCLGRVTQAIFLGFSIEVLATTQSSGMWPGNFPFCIPRKRIKFLKQDNSGSLVAGKSPTHSNVIVYLPPIADRAKATSKFDSAFLSLGKVRI